MLSLENIKCTLEVCVNVGADEQCVRDLSLILAAKLRKRGSLAGEEAFELRSAHILHIRLGTEIVLSGQVMRYHM